MIAATSPWNYVVAAYLVTFGLMAGYVWFVVHRGRKAGRQLPPDERRWM